MGSRILSRSFHVEEWKGEDGNEEHDDDNGEEDEAPELIPAAMDVDEEGSLQDTDPAGEAAAPPGDHSMDEDIAADDSEGEDEDDEDPSDVAMVPMADMLNARFESENVRSSSFRTLSAD